LGGAPSVDGAVAEDRHRDAGAQLAAGPGLALAVVALQLAGAEAVSTEEAGAPEGRGRLDDRVEAQLRVAADGDAGHAGAPGWVEGPGGGERVALGGLHVGARGEELGREGPGRLQDLRERQRGRRLGGRQQEEQGPGHDFVPLAFFSPSGGRMVGGKPLKRRQAS